VRTSRNVSKKRFENSAITNIKILSILWPDLKKNNLESVYAELLFRIGINYILSWTKKTWLMYLWQSLRTRFNIKYFVVFLLSLLSRAVVYKLFRLYTRND
jgi:hypothetical protein